MMRHGLSKLVAVGTMEVSISPRINISKIWFDEHLVELKIEVCDGRSLFSNKIYAQHHEITDAVSKLDVFKDQVRGGSLDIQFGSFGIELANGCFRAHFQFDDLGRLFVTCDQEADFEPFNKNDVASSAKLYLQVEIGQLDRFIKELRALASGTTEEANLSAI